jgi:hypothetical protein
MVQKGIRDATASNAVMADAASMIRPFFHRSVDASYLSPTKGRQSQEAPMPGGEL